MGQKILVVDDSATIRQELRTVLAASGYDVLEAIDGADGAEQIRRSPDMAMVICDVNMPRMSGIEMVRKVRDGGQNPALPILMLTTEGSGKIIMEAKAAGARGWLVKPFKADQLIATVKKMARP